MYSPNIPPNNSSPILSIIKASSHHVITKYATNHSSHLLFKNIDRSRTSHDLLKLIYWSLSHDGVWPLNHDSKDLLLIISTSSYFSNRSRNESMNSEASKVDPSLLDYSVRPIPISLRSKNEEEEEAKQYWQSTRCWRERRGCSQVGQEEVQEEEEEGDEEYDDEVLVEEKLFQLCMRFLRSNGSRLRDVSSLSNSSNHPLRAHLISWVHGMKEWLADKCKISPIEEEEEIEIEFESHSSIHNMKCENVNGMDEKFDFSEEEKEEEEEWDFIDDEEDDSIYFMSRDDAFNDKVCVVVGSTQSGKTSFVHLICNEVGVKTIEMNTSQVFIYSLVTFLFF